MDFFFREEKQNLPGLSAHHGFLGGTKDAFRPPKTCDLQSEWKKEKKSILRRVEDVAEDPRISPGRHEKKTNPALVVV